MSDVEIPADLEAVFARHFPDAAAEPASPSSEAAGGGGDLPPAAVPEIDDGTQPLSTLPPGVTEEGLTDTEVPSTLEPGSPPSEPLTPSPASGEGVVGQSAPSPTTYEGFDANVAFERFMGEKPSAEKVEQLLNFYADAATLDPDRGRYVSFLMGGGDPAELAAHLAQQYVQTPPVGSVDPTRTSEHNYLDDEDDELPPRVQAELESIKQTQAQLAAVEQQRLLDDQERTRQWYENEYNSAADEWARSQPIDIPPEHLSILKVKANRSGLFPAFLQANGNDPRRATAELLRYTVGADPAESQRMIDAQVQAEVTRQLEDRTRQQKASSVSAGGNSAAAPIDTNQPLTKDQARAGALEFLDGVMNDGQPA